MIHIQELRDKTQKAKLEQKYRAWHYKPLQRGPSIFITAVLIKTSISANAVSILSIFAGILGAFILLFPTPYGIIIGLLIFYLNILLDKVDGEIARYRNQFSVRGVFLDEINHLVVPALFFISMMFHIALYMPLSLTLAPIVFVAGIAAALAMSFIRTGWSLAPQIFAKKYMKHPELFNLPEIPTDKGLDDFKQQHGILSSIMRFIHHFQDFMMILLLFFVGIIVQLATDTFILQYILIGYGILLPLIFVENTVKGYFSVESRIHDLRDRFLS